jgi:site-specific recombinase XerD
MRYFLKEIGLHLDKKGNPRSSYSLRHFYITQRLEANVPLHAVAHNCGTSYLQLYNTYSHLLTWNMRTHLTKNHSRWMKKEVDTEHPREVELLDNEDVDVSILSKVYT